MTKKLLIPPIILAVSVVGGLWCKITETDVKVIPPVQQVRVEPSFECEFDIEGMDVFSVERSMAEPGVTVIAYHTPGKDDVEWLMKTSDTQHADFLARYRKKLGR